ncbi:hypothetical protein CANARDRAFT_178846, partial [[Candida] arabinofermentans NRRL YB-2248]
ESDDEESQEYKKSMTEKEQFELTAEYRKLDSDLIEQRSRVNGEEGVLLVSKLLDRADGLFVKTKMSIQSNIAAKDSATLKEIGNQAKLATRNSKLGRSERHLDFDQFASNFVRLFTKDHHDYGDEADVDDDDITANDDDDVNSKEINKYDWNHVGLMFLNNSNRSPTMDFLLGPLDIKVRSRNYGERLVDDTKGNKNMKTANIKSASVLMDQDKQDDTTANSERYFRKLKEVNLEKVPLFEFVLDPNSFGKSVENLFYTSFLINHGKIILGKSEEGLPYLQEAKPETYGNLTRAKTRDSGKSHIIFKLDHSTWKNLVQFYGINRSFL